MSRAIRCVLGVLALVVPALALAPAAEAGPAVVVIGLGAPVPDHAAALRPGTVVETGVPAGTRAVGLTWAGEPASLQLRSLGPDGWSGWVELESEVDHGDGAAAMHGAGPVWTGPGTRAIALKSVAGAPTGLVVHADSPTADGVNTVGPAGTSAGPSGTVAGSRTGARQRTVLPTAAWGSPGWSYRNCPSGPEVTRPVDAVVVHHTATTTTYAAHQVDDVLRSIHRFHTITRGWCDIAYNVLVDRFGRIWEGRSGGLSLPVRGGHARGFNTGTTGISLLGNFDEHGVPPAAAEAVALLASWKAAANDFDPTGVVERTSGGSTSIPRGRRVVIGRVAGHRDVSSSTCPGRHGHATLDHIRHRAATRLTPPKSFTFGGAIGDVLLTGDWTGDAPGVGVYRAGAFHLRNALAAGPADSVVRFGLPGDEPVVGDWDGDGVDTVGVERNGRFHLLGRNRTPEGLDALVGGRVVRPAVPDDYPLHRAHPLAGDWNGDGVDTVGYAADGEILLFDDPWAQQVSRRYRIGRAGDRAVVADWDADGTDDVGLVRDGVMYAPLPWAHRSLRPVHRLPDGRAAFVVDWTGLGLPTLLTGAPDGSWDPTTPVGL